MFETFVLIGSGFFALYCHFQNQKLKEKFQKEAGAYYEEEIFKIKRSHEFEISMLEDKLQTAEELVTKLRAKKEKEKKVAKKENAIEKALASFI